MSAKMSAQYEVQDGVAVISLQNPPVNSLGRATRMAVIEGVLAANADENVNAMVITGSGRGFCGGADIKEFGKPGGIKEPAFLSLMNTVEQSAKPVVAAVHGICLGGGLELALACHYRLFAAGTQLGFPEVNLGIIPGAGGTQRLPRLVGIETALQLIRSGKPVKSEEAASWEGQQLVTQLVDADADLVAAAVQFAREKADSKPPRTRDMPCTHPQAQGFFAFAKMSAPRFAGGAVAPVVAIEAVEAATRLPFDKGIAREEELFVQLMRSPQARALQHVFLAKRAAGKITDVPSDTAKREIKKVGIVGAGTMGSGIAICFMNAGYPVTVLETKQEALDRGTAHIRSTYDGRVAKGRMDETKRDAVMQLLNTTLDYADLADADLVVEAVFEDMGVKEQVFKQLDAVCKPGAILATNTSTLDVNAIAALTERPQDVLGLHFFSPANIMKLLEVVRAEKTGNEALATAMQLGKKLRKVAVVSGVCDGFIGNRMVDPYVRQAGFMLDEGCTPQQIDRAAEKLGFAMGPFRMMDMAGNDIFTSIRNRQKEQYPGKKYSCTLDIVAKLERHGQKNGKGWYDYPDGRKPVHSVLMADMLEQCQTECDAIQRPLDTAEIQDRLLYALVNEGAKILQEGIAARSSDIDMVYLTGYGFPQLTGGPMHLANERGLYNVLTRMQEFARNPNDGSAAFWEPAQLLSDLAQKGGRFQ